MRQMLLALLLCMALSALPGAAEAANAPDAATLQAVQEEVGQYMLEALQGDESAWQKAEDMLNEELEEFPDELSLIFSRANVRMGMKRYEDARADFQIIMKARPSPQVQTGICLLTDRLGASYEDSVACHRKVLTFDPGAPYADDLQELEWLLAKFLADQPGSVDALKAFFASHEDNELAEVWQDALGDYNRATFVRNILP